MPTHYCPCSPGRLLLEAHTHHDTPPVPVHVGVRGDDDPEHVAYVTRTYNTDGTLK